jgi:CRISPR-associated protein Cmr5
VPDRNTTSTQKFNRDQLRAQAAQRSVLQVTKLPQVDRDDYFGEAKKMPIRIMASGLGQALAFIGAKAKKKDGLKRLQQDLSVWVLDLVKHETCGVVCPSGTSDLLHHIIHGESAFVRQATDETLAYLRWLNRFAEAVSVESDN